MIVKSKLQKCLMQLPPQIIIQTYVSMTGWEAVCQRQTRGTCSVQEWSWHINILELLAVKPALLVFTKERHVKSVHFQIAKTDLRYVLKMGGTKNQKLIRLKQGDLGTCSFSGITFTAEYLCNEYNGRLGVTGG